MPERTDGQRERRRATVLFADLSGFTKLSEGLDPEDVTDITSEIFRKFDAIIKSYDGHLDKTMGDAVMAVFGAPPPTRTTPSAPSTAQWECRRQSARSTVTPRLNPAARPCRCGSG